jgi:outer membrane receptor for ferric coprogen and ferric-rhodotorulic acid
MAIGEVFSKGVELEASGEVLPGWQIQAGYSYNENYYGKEYGTYYGSYGDYQSQQPRHQFKAWNSYVLPDRWSRLTVGGGLRLESARFTEGSVCSVAVTATGSCPSEIFVPFNFTQSFYGVVDLRVAYKLDDHWQAALNVTNIGDTRYYATAGSSTGGNFYGEPRAFAFNIRGTF